MNVEAHTSLDDLLRTRRLIVCVGPGGVGKTTGSAAMALRAARMGRRALVLTIDPAKRLADALGLDGLDDEVRRVPGLGALEPLPGAPAMGTLDAAMLDTKASYDALLTRLTDAAARERIFANRAYQAFSRTMARSHAYVAMERLLHVVEEERWDLIVLDTPPTRSALDILDAPERLSRFLDERIVQWFLGGRADEGDEGSAPRERSDSLGGRAAVKLLGVLVGAEVVQELVSFFAVLAHLQKGFRERAARTKQLLESPSTAFVLTAAPMPSGLADAANLLEGLRERGVALALLLFNRAYTAEPVITEGDEENIAYEPLRPPPDVASVAALSVELTALAERLSAVRAAALAENQADAERMRALRGAAGGAPAWLLPRATRELSRLEDLSALLERPVRLGS